MQDLHVSHYKSINFDTVELTIKDGVGVMNTSIGEIKVNQMKRVNNNVMGHCGKNSYHTEVVDLNQDGVISGILAGYQRGRAWWLLLHPSDLEKPPVILGYHYYSN